MNISNDEYEQRRQIFDSFLWIQQKLNILRQEPDFEEKYFERKGNNLKKILEEAIPICRLGLLFCKEWNTVFVRYITNTKPDEQNFDAILEIKNPEETSNQTIKVEVTSTQNEESNMRRQALSRNGFVHFTGKVRRDGHKIISEGEFVDTEEENEKLIKLTLQRIETKLGNSYDETTAILVYVNSFRKLGHHNRYDLIERTTKLLREKKPRIYGVFFCYDENLGIDGITNNLQRFNLSP